MQIEGGQYIVSIVRINKWDTLEPNFSIPNGVAIMGARDHDEFVLLQICGKYALA